MPAPAGLGHTLGRMKPALAVCLLFAACPPPTVVPDGGTDEDAAGFDMPDATVMDAGQSVPGPFRVLFIGNSYTFANDLPGMLGKLAASADVDLTYDSVVVPGATLDLHWNAGLARQRIHEAPWTHVVIQGQSLEPFFGTHAFVETARRFGLAVSDAGATPVWYVTWPRAPGDGLYAWADPTYDELADGITAAYASAAAGVPGSVLSCVGAAFRAATAERPALALYDADRSHPSATGTFLAAATFWVVLTQRAVPSGWAPSGLSASDAQYLREKATVGTGCAHVGLRPRVRIAEHAGTQAPLPDGGAPFRFRPTAFPEAHPFLVTNPRGPAASLADGMTLMPPFGWTSGAYPGGTGTVDVGTSRLPFCAGVLAPGQTCALLVTFSGATDATGAVSLFVAGSYAPVVWRAVEGPRAWGPALRLTALDAPPCSSASNLCSYPLPTVMPRGAVTLLRAFNAGAADITALGEASPPSARFAWANDAGFPGIEGGCTNAGLPAGASCLLALRYEGDFETVGSLTLAWSDGVDGGTVTRTLRGVGDAGS